MVLTPGKVSVSLISFARPWNLPIICESLLRYGFRDIHLVDNWQGDEFKDIKLFDPSSDDDFQKTTTKQPVDDLIMTQFTPELRSKINFVKSGVNCRTAARYAILPKAKNEIIATVDDDYIVTPLGWDRLLSAWNGDRIVAQLPAENGQFASSQKIPFLNIGYGSLFRKSWPTAIFPYLMDNNAIQEKDWNRFGDRIFTTFMGVWTTIEATKETLIPLVNHDGKASETDVSAIHLQKGYWADQWELVTRVILKRAEARQHFNDRSHSLSGYRNQMGFLSHIGRGEYLPENG